MPDTTILIRAARVALCLAATAGGVQLASAQSATPDPAASSTAAATAFGGPVDPSPYYIGVGESLTHDSNVYRVPNGRSDNYSSTSLRAGFTQPISRQRVFGAASVSVNRYQDQTSLNNTSYALSAGANWETIWRLAGDLDASMGRNLSAPVASGFNGAQVRNIVDTRNVDASARWGGASLLTLEANAGWSSADYANAGSNSGDSRQSRGGLGVYYRPGGPLTLGLAGRVDRTESPYALVSATGSAQSNTVHDRTLEFIAGYVVSGFITANGRVGYTKQTNSSVSAQEFSGLTGGLSVGWQPTSKTGFHFDAARHAGSDAGQYGAAPVPLPGVGSGASGAPTTPAVTTPGSVYYENNRVTDSLVLGATHATTAKIGLNADARYSRAHIVAGSALTAVGTTPANSADTAKLASVGVNYAINRAWNLGCNVSREWRDVEGGVNFAYRANSIGCATQLTLR